MAKGIKKIKWTGTGEIMPKLSVTNQKITIKADQFVYFNVSEWFDSTPESDKSKNRFWTLLAHTKKDVLLEQTLTADQNFGVRIEKKFCGSYEYYLQANLSKERNFLYTGLAISGYCEPKITTSKWCTTNDGDDVRSSHTFSYGHKIYLTINTEGLNGNKNLELEIYRQVGGNSSNDDLLIAHFTKVEVTNGEIDLSINDTGSWYGKLMTKGIKDIEQFYVKVKNPVTGKYILNDKKETCHAEFLKIKKILDPQQPKPPQNLTPLKIGELEVSYKRYQLCKFSKITLSCKEEKDAVIFNEGKFIRKINPNDNTIALERIFYDYDKWNIRADAKIKLNEIAKYLIEPPYLPIVLGSHTDCRGTNQYNADLSLKRAQSVVEYLIQQGVDKTKITAIGYGESKLINHGEDISEALHQENRRTSIKFNVFGNDGQTLMHNVIVPSYKMPRQIKINIDDFSRDCCFKKEQHKNEIIVFDSYKKKKIFPLKSQKEGEKIKNIITHSIHSFTPDIPDLYSSFFSDATNIYSFKINSCAYYSNPENKTFAIKAYPDVNWVIHLNYNYSDAPFFKEIKVPLVVGIDMIRQIEIAIKEVIKGIAFLSEDLAKNAETISAYITEMPEKFGVGMHALHDFSNPKTPTQRIDYTQKYKWLTEIYIAELCVGIILIDLLIVWFTKGKGSFARIRKFKKVLKAKKKFDELGFEFIEPKIAYSQGLYFEKLIDGRIAQVNVTYIKANPLIGVNYDKEHNIEDLVKESGDPEGSRKLFQRYGLKATLHLYIKGEIKADYSVQYNSLTKAIDIIDRINSSLNSSKGKFTGATIITASAELEVNGVAETTIEWIPLFPDQKIKVEIDLKVKLGGYIAFSRQYGMENRKLYFIDIMEFSGLKGTYTLKGKASKNGRVRMDYNPEEKSVPFELFGKQVFTTGKAYSFNI